MADRIVEHETVLTDRAVRPVVVDQTLTHIGHGHSEEVGGAMAGAVSGAVIGSIVPGIGTAVGAAVGGVAGAIAGKADEDHKGTVVEEHTTRSREVSQRQAG